MTDQTHCASCEKPLDSGDLGSGGYGLSGILLCAACRKLSAAQCRNGWLPVMQWEAEWDGLRLASLAPVPWGDRDVVLLRITRGGGISVTHTLTGKRRMLQESVASDMLLVAWPGTRRQDVFIVDDRKAAARALQPKGR